MRAACRREEFPNDDKVVARYRKGVAKGMLKVMAKMGISTLQSYKGAQIFEAVGLQAGDRATAALPGPPAACRAWASTSWPRKRCAATRWAIRHRVTDQLAELPNPGEFHWRSGGERHMWDPETIANLQVAARTNSRDAYRQFAEHANNDARTRCTLRGLLRFKEPAQGGRLT